MLRDDTGSYPGDGRKDKRIETSSVSNAIERKIVKKSNILTMGGTVKLCLAVLLIQNVIPAKAGIQHKMVFAEGGALKLKTKNFQTDHGSVWIRFSLNPVRRRLSAGR